MGEWKHGLFGCFGNFSVCVITFFAPCYTEGKIAEAAGQNCLLWGLLILIPGVNVITACHIRGEVRKSKGVDGSVISDLLMHFCCMPCALCQESRETGALGSTDMAGDGAAQVMERA